ncbi:hypothetical protein NY98_09215 [Xanthomonas citri pv. fuscans]|uniref:Uncharacterized protein n=1 Tax=Xanthomonas citri pv. fuscans TaxID=366649 RepID=A0AB34Q996_XANCI|nr:hypothetical protein TP37_02815 [Xanthomonas citri pv. aurantifolii]AZU16045.1 hypothetical protein AC613_02775 [Xanthomonas citri pv. fuscans]KGP31838.1 hypothetical protein NY65_05550 [Xanthomonas phaseoli pv. phaseoli]MBZ3932268.1 hypothetical protein [Xanthomonas campestris pv. merremiae]OQP78119.1 hypothetical protein IB69_008450 [Xanthomonas citri]
MVIAKRAAGLDVGNAGVSVRMCAQWALAGARDNGAHVGTSTRGELACSGTCWRTSLVATQSRPPAFQP